MPRFSEVAMTSSGANEALLAAYAQHLATQPARTREAYLRDVGVLKALAGEAALTALPPAMLRRFLAALHARGLSGRSLARMLSGWRAFYRFALEHDAALKDDPCAGLKAPKSARRLPAALSGLDVASVDLATGEVRVWGKGSKERIVPVGAAAREAIRVWLKVRGGLSVRDADAMFLSRSGRRIAPRAIERRLADWAIKRGLSRHVHPHMLRHSFASHLLQSSGDLRAVQEMLGHASIASTQVYTHLDFQYLAKIYDQAHPRARKKT